MAILYSKIARTDMANGAGYKLLCMGPLEKTGVAGCYKLDVDMLYLDEKGYIFAVTLKPSGKTEVLFNTSFNESECALQLPDGRIVDIGCKWGSDVKEKWLAALRAGEL